MSTKQISQLATRLLKTFQAVNKAAKADTGLADLAKQLDESWLMAHRLAESRALAEAERKDARLPAQERVCWTLFKPDELLGMQIVTRTPNRVIRERVPTFMDAVGAALFSKAGDKDRFKPEARMARPGEAIADLQQEWASDNYRDPITRMQKRVAFVLSEWGQRHEKARRREAAELAQAERERLEKSDGLEQEKQNPFDQMRKALNQ